MTETTITYREGYAEVTTGAITMLVLVKKTEQGNPSARGGAYRTVWVASARGKKFTADTRKAAVALAIQSLRARGFQI